MNFNRRFMNVILVTLTLLLVTGCGGCTEMPTSGSTIEGGLWHH